MNTHKGAIWIIGLLVAAASHIDEVEPSHLVKVAGAISRRPDRARPELLTHGDLVRARYGVAGARGEAQADCPHVIDVGLPLLRAARSDGRSEYASRLCALLGIMSRLDDTCVLYRRGEEGAEFVRAGASAVLAAGGPGSIDGDAVLHQFDRDLFDWRIQINDAGATPGSVSLRLEQAAEEINQ